ncbi:MAG: hypothetical protein LBH51_04475 [Treponema sp.]|jgi:tetratricopeptide (TPR) repeat protein|nr:hypothetical protein [Treponema sp.]
MAKYTGRFAAAAIGLLLLGACSSAPAKPPEIRLRRNGAEQQLELANRQAERGDLAGALSLLELARQLAVAADDTGLRVRTSLSRGNVLFYQGRRDEAAAEWTAAEADAAGDPALAALVRIYIARGGLLRAAAEGRGAEAADSAIQELNRALNQLREDKISTALGWTVIGLAEKEGGRFSAAESAVQKALALHLGENYLEQAAYDWYLIASIRSVAGKYGEAEAALEEALALDRRSENSWGLAMDWRALAEVYRKAGKSSQAEAAAARSAEILQALGRP